MFTELKYFSAAGGTANEDAVVCGANYLVVIDAATGLEQFHFTEEATDARWFSKTLAELLDSELRKIEASTSSLVTILERAASELKESLDKYGYSDYGNGYPSACVSILRDVGDTLEYLVLGDCPILLEEAKGIRLLYDDTVAKRDDKVVEWIKMQCRTRGITFAQARKEAQPMLLKNRREMNRPDSYWIFDPTGVGVKHALTGTLDANTVKGVAMMSDGFYEAYEVFGMATSLTEFYFMIKNQSLEELVSRLRMKQEIGMEVEQFCRLKERDDASVIWAKHELALFR